MGVLTNSSSSTYYGTNGTHGDYRFLPLSDVISSFMGAYVGPGKICENTTSQDVTFHAVRGLQELSYDTLRSTKEWEVEVPASLMLVMPIDYIDYVKLCWTDSNGVERIIYPTTKTSNPSNIVPSVKSWGGFDTPFSSTESSDTSAAFNQVAQATSDTDVDTVSDASGGRYGLDPTTAQSNGSFYVDHKSGKFHFGSSLAGKTLVLKYISDGVVTTGTSIDMTDTLVPKLAEEAIYKHMLYGVLLSRKDTPGGLMAQVKKERFAETRKAKIRLSNLKPEEIIQSLRGGSKTIKH
tara:strand:- start:1773 stop:2654 length:882 start_codon:yes stop_codon:yes gene_type:complete